MKNLLILLFCLIMCFLSACAPESVETTGTSASKGSNDIADKNTSGSQPPPQIHLRPIGFLKQALLAVDGSEEEFADFYNQVLSSVVFDDATQPMMKELKEKLLISGLPFSKQDITLEPCEILYYHIWDVLYISYCIDDILYCFSYCYDVPNVVSVEEEVVIKDYQIGPYTMDLSYRKPYYEGRVVLDNAILIIQIRTDDPPPDASDLFEFKPLDLSTSTENENTTDDNIIEGSGMDAVGFDSIEQIREALTVCEKSEAEYKEFLMQMHRGHASQDIIRHWKTLLSAHDFPFVKDDKNQADFLCTYYYSFQNTTVFYSIDGIQYKLMYFYNEVKYTPLEGDLAVTDYHIGSYIFDLYQNGENNYFGRIDLNDSVILHIDIRSDRIPPDASDLFEFKPLDLSTPTE